jgi:hypothetical protein
MKSPLKKPCYKQAPIRTLSTLAETLCLTPAQLAKLCANADRMYILKPQLKDDGTTRVTWDAKPQLKEVQEKIKNKLLRAVEYPRYLQGGIKDAEAPRDYVRNAAFHAGARCMVVMDIESFFPSTTADLVRQVWEGFFKFPPAVAQALTSLTTLSGILPQGAKTSNHIANLVFWRTEHEIISALEARGWTYSRHTDDIAISIRRPYVEEDIRCANQMLASFVSRYSYRIKRKKHHVYPRNVRMVLHKLTVNVHPALPLSKRAAIRAQHHQLKRAEAAGAQLDPHFVNSTRGKVNLLFRFHAPTAARILGSDTGGSRK